MIKRCSSLNINLKCCQTLLGNQIIQEDSYHSLLKGIHHFGSRLKKQEGEIKKSCLSCNRSKVLSYFSRDQIQSRKVHFTLRWRHTLFYPSNQGTIQKENQEINIIIVMLITPFILYYLAPVDLTNLLRKF